jgi:hypothetical protein
MAAAAAGVAADFSAAVAVVAGITAAAAAAVMAVVAGEATAKGVEEATGVVDIMAGTSRIHSIFGKCVFCTSERTRQWVRFRASHHARTPFVGHAFKRRSISQPAVYLTV